uniref:Reticulon-like protein n=1 Tax=Araucaria cunninghamii TaxID=56994 RepID=A0A0D6QRM3_ARACU
MPEQSGKILAENLLDNIMETFVDSVPKQKASTIFETSQKPSVSASFNQLFETSEKSSVSESFNRLFGRQKPVHHLLGGGKSADVLLWRNKRISGSILAGATLIWLLFEWLNYHLLPIICIGLVISMLILFVWSHSTAFLNRSPPNIPQLTLPEDIFIEGATVLRNEINSFLKFIQDVATGSDLKTFVMVAAALTFIAMIAGWCNFLTLIYIGFVSAHTLPVLYEKYEDQVDSFIYNALDKGKGHYRRFDSSVRSRIPRSYSKGKRSD